MATKNKRVGKKSNKKLMSEITATEKRATEKNGNRKMGNGKLGNRKTRQQKWADRKKGQHRVTVRKERQRYFRLQKKMATGKMSDNKWATDINAEETVTRR